LLSPSHQNEIEFVLRQLSGELSADARRGAGDKRPRSEALQQRRIGISFLHWKPLHAGATMQLFPALAVHRVGKSIVGRNCA
jgi:hypothetical protein